MKSNQLLLVVAVAVVAVAAGVFYFVTRPDAPNFTPAGGSATVATASASDLMVPGPLGDKALGKPDAPNVVIEYASMTCSHCQRFHEETFDAFKAKYIDTGNVYFILREYPLDPLATSAIMLARCAPGDKYFPLVDLLFEQQRSWAFVSNPAEALFNMVRQAGFTKETFEACLRDQKILDAVNDVKNRGTQLGVDATPTFFFNGQKKSGALTLAEIDKILAN